MAAPRRDRERPVLQRAVVAGEPDARVDGNVVLVGDEIEGVEPGRRAALRAFGQEPAAVGHGGAGQHDRRRRRRRRRRRPATGGERLDALSAGERERRGRHHHPLVAGRARRDPWIEVSELVARRRHFELDARHTGARHLGADVLLRERRRRATVDHGEVGVGANVVVDAERVVAAVVDDHRHRGRGRRAVRVHGAPVVDAGRPWAGLPPAEQELVALGVVADFGDVRVVRGGHVDRGAERAVDRAHRPRLDRRRPGRLVEVAIGDEELVAGRAVADADLELGVIVERDVDGAAHQLPGGRDQLGPDVLARLSAAAVLVVDDEEALADRRVGHRGGPLRIDTADRRADQEIRTGERRRAAGAVADEAAVDVGDVAGRVVAHVEPGHQELAVAVLDARPLAVGSGGGNVELVGTERHAVGRLEPSVGHRRGDHQVDVVDGVVGDVGKAQAEPGPGAGRREGRALARGLGLAGSGQGGDAEDQRGSGSGEPRSNHRSVRLPARRVTRGGEWPAHLIGHQRASLYYGRATTSRLSRLRTREPAGTRQTARSALGACTEQPCRNYEDFPETGIR